MISDEHAHAGGTGDLWADSWYFDFARPDGVGGFVHLAVYPNLRVAWWWTHLLAGGGLVAVRDHEVPPPRTGLEVRADGLWADVVCETPLEHWTIGLEAFGVRFDDPAEAWGDEWGERMPVGLDIEWEETGPPAGDALPGPGADREGGYRQPGRVQGELLVGSERIAFDGPGHRARRWGIADWWSGAGTGVRRHWGAYQQAAGGAAEAFAVPDEGGIAAEVVRADFDGNGLPAGADYMVGGRRVEAAVLGVAPVLLTGPAGRRARLARALCRFDAPGGGGFGWAEWLLGP